MAKVKCIAVYYDLEDKVQRNPGEAFECSDERAELLRGLKLVEVLKEATKPEPEEATPKEEKKEKATAKTKRVKK